MPQPFKVDTTSPRTVLLVSSGYHLYREYLLRMISNHARVWLFIDRESQWERPYVTGSTKVDTLDVDAMLTAARDLRAEVAFDGVICWDEIRIVHAARLAETLGLPSGPSQAISNCRDKHRTRGALAAAGVPQARSIAVSTAAEADAAAQAIGYPVIVKPRALGASFGVSLVDGPRELATAYAHARDAREDGVPSFDAGVLIEEYMDGPEISVDAAFADGEMQPLYLARKVTGFYPHFEETGHVVDAADPLLEDPALRQVLAGAHQAVGLQTGITHTELRLTRSGPKIVEINARLGGDMIPYVGWLASGIDPGRVAVEVACGQLPVVEHARRDVAAIRFLYPERDVVVADVRVDETRLPPAVDLARVLASPGQRLVLPPNDHVSCRYGYVVVRGESAEACNAAAKEAERAFTLSGSADEARSLGVS
ncbi:ATP-grasp domain-containing protein [Corallococcus sp. Z5C101001]|uniref:ATP-grasp domain-containing protein n=1 Tax=Corallococcus sp. Z5C101001 TaxID=2596829 RepID=UPI00117E2EFF|nr:ATP-grasp domain-containing protein [Corallococcus sp. Z5C101001]TSC34431.1 ATP-grasp domain-containing protein [Corallococcus sp. Z5C101001]